ncbi:Ankyrin repeat-containing protein [Vitis vinifera]|uniref:Ankyrin repeat-containing protein n=1 Tax=Vitis vinifera TaxID=29760 RepID=A0A438GKX7_VITVI|nr:Ankyrin repeat-containing protein [Vitis vinifera]
MSNQIAADGQTEITHMDADLYEALYESDIRILERKYSEAHLQLQQTPKRNTVLHIAAQFGQLASVEWILHFHSCSPLLQQPNRKGDTPLHLAAREGHGAIVKALLDAAKTLHQEIESGVGTDKAMLRMTNKEKDTALHEAVRYHHSEIVVSLIEEDPEFIYGANITGYTPLYMAAERGYGDLVCIIIDKTRASPSHSGIMGRTALHAAVIHEDQDKSSDKSVTYLAIKDTKKTALHFAANRHHRETVKLLLSHSPDCCEQVDDQGNNFLHFAAMSKRPFAIDDLFPNDNKLRVRGLVNEKDDKGDTPLHLLSSCQCYNPVFSMDNAVDKMALNDDKLTALDILSRANIKSGQMFGAINKDNGSSSKNKDVREDESMAFTERLGETHLIVATLVATVSCAAGFTLPGGYNDSDGMAKLTKQVAFKAFIVTDTLAMMLSVSAVFVYFVMSLHKDEDILANN